MKEILNFVTIFCIVSISLIVLLFLSCLIPSNRLKQNVYETSQIIKEEKWIKTIGSKVSDNFTEELMTNMAYSIDSKDPIYSMFLSRRNYVPGVTQNTYEDTSQELQVATDFDGIDGETELEKIINNKNIDSYEYARYWHGYLVYFRPLLILFNIKGIRIILELIVLATTAYMIYLVTKKTNYINMLIFVVAFLGIDITLVGISMQGAICFIISNIISILILKNKSESSNSAILKLFMISRNVNIIF